MSRLFLGVDPGLSGAVAMLTELGELWMVEDMPTIARGRGKVRREIDAAALSRLLAPHASDVAMGCVELVAARPGQGVASVFSLGHSLGAAVGVLASLAVPLVMPTPATWKKATGTDRDKELARAAAVRRWPSAPLGRKADHNRAEALLLAAYAMSQHATGSTG